jgi:hypothetical protein
LVCAQKGQSWHIPTTTIALKPDNVDPPPEFDRVNTSNPTHLVLTMVAFAALSPTLGASIYNPAFEQLREELGATDTQLSLSVSLFILFQGGWPICEFGLCGLGAEGGVGEPELEADRSA